MTTTAPTATQHSTPITSPQQRYRVLIGILLLWLLFSALAYFTWVQRQGNTFDLYPRWYGAREMLQGENPYSEEINRQVLKDMGYDYYLPYKHNFAYPAYITYVLLVFWLLPFPLAISLWSGLNLLWMTILPLLTFMTLRWRVPPLVLGVVIFLSAFLFRHTVHVFLFGNFILFVLACLILAWMMIVRDNHWLAGLALVGASIRPDGAMLVAALLFYLLMTRRFKMIAVWAGVTGVIFVLSVLQAGWWIPDVLDNIRGYRDCCLYAYPPEIFGVEWLEPIFVIGVIIWAGWMLWQIRALPDLTRIAWGLSILIIVSLLVLTQTKDYTLVYGLLPAWVIVWSSRGKWWSLLAYAAVMLSCWVYFTSKATLPDGYPLEQTLTPLFLGILLSIHLWYWKKKQAEIEGYSAAVNLP